MSKKTKVFAPLLLLYGRLHWHRHDDLLPCSASLPHRNGSLLFRKSPAKGTRQAVARARRGGNRGRRGPFRNGGHSATRMSSR